MAEPLLSRQGAPAPGDDAELRRRAFRRSGSISSRILDRDAEFRQSRGRWRVERLTRGHRQHVNFCRRCFQKVWREWITGDWFHRLAYMRTVPLLALFFVAYSAIIAFFAFVYLTTSELGRQITTNPDGSSNVIPFCDMDVNDHLEALYFSLSTMTTIGYGVSNYYYSGCWTPLLLVLWQVCTAILFDAIAVGLIFHRISRGRKRGKTITFSDKAVVRRVRGVPYLMFRLGELRRYSLVEASLRVYCVKHERHAVPRQQPWQHGRAIRSSVCTADGTGTNRDDGVGATPTTAAITAKTTTKTTAPESTGTLRTAPEPDAEGDTGSPLLGVPSSSSSSSLQPPPQSPLSPPPPPTMDEIEVETTHFVTRQVRLLNPDESFGNHILMSIPQVVVHRLDGGSPLTPSQPVWYDGDGRAHPGVLEFENIRLFLEDRLAEIVVLVEGTDEGTGAAVQARHSYTASDLAWNKTFVSCIGPHPSLNDDDDDGNDDDGDSRQQDALLVHDRRRQQRPSSRIVAVDFSKFHDVKDAPLDCGACPYVPDDDAV